MNNRHLRHRLRLALWGLAILMFVGCAAVSPPTARRTWDLKALVQPVQASVTTVINYDMDGNVASIGSGFFLSSDGILLTNHHVLDGAYSASVRTHDGTTYPVSAVVAANQVIDLITVRVDIPADRVSPAVLSDSPPSVGDSIFVVGSPMGLEQTVSEGIISAIRDLPAGSSILQLTAPISQGSSGGPVIDTDGHVVGVVSFQASRGQNLNFAISVDTLDMLSAEAPLRSVAEWTIRHSNQGPALAAALCSKGSQLTIRGEYEAALTFFEKAAEANPDDPDAWYGLGSCYVGLDRPDDAIAAYQRPIDRDPDNAAAHFVLAMYFKALAQYEQEIGPLLEIIRIDPANVRARFELGQAYGALDRTDDQIDTFDAILAFQPDHTPTLLNLGMTLGIAGRLDEAITMFTRAGNLEPDNELIHYNIGVVHSRMGEPEEAIRAYTRAIRIDPQMAPAHYNLGLTYLDLGRRKMALDQYEILKALNREAAGRLFEQIYPESADVQTPSIID